MIYHGINYIPNPSNDLLNIAQDLAVQSISKFSSPDVKFVSLQFRGEDAAPNADISVALDRDSLGITERRLPFVLDIFNNIANLCTDKDDWIGFTNSDIVIKSETFYSEIRNSASKALLFNRVEIQDVELTRELDKFLNYSGKPNPFNGRDGFFFRKEIWDIIKTKLPDYIIAEPRWDIGFIKLLKEYDPKVVENQIYHYSHPYRWKENTPGAIYNNSLFVKQKAEAINNQI